MANELYRTYEVLVEESIHPDHPKRAKDKTSKESKFNGEIDGALRDTHMIFQDAVCFNTLCFAGLAGLEVHQSGEREGELLNPLWKHLTTPAAQGGIKEETERMIRRLATHYKPLEGIKTADEFLNRVYSAPLQILDSMTQPEKADALRKRATCFHLLEKYGTKEKENGGRECKDMAAFARTWINLISSPDSDAEIPGNGAYHRLSRELKKKLEGVKDDKQAHQIVEEAIQRYSREAVDWNTEECARRYDDELAKLASEVECAENLSDTDTTKIKKLAAAKKALEKHKTGRKEIEKKFFEHSKSLLDEAASDALSDPFSAKDADEISVSESEFAMAKAAVSAKAGVNLKPIRLSYRKGPKNALESAVIRYWTLREHENQNDIVRKVALADFCYAIKKHKPEDDPGVEKMPYKGTAKIAFPFFCTLCLGIPTNDNSPDWEFDKTAFAAAAEDVFKYQIRTAKRVREVARLRNIVGAYEGKGVDAEHSPTGNPIRGMKDDPRWLGVDENKKGIKQLMEELSAEKEIGSYGLREGTIGGWAEVRKMFLRRYKQCVGRPKRMAVLPDWLERGVDKEQTANRQGFGSADFFHALCDPAYFHLWLDDLGNAFNKIRDFIPHYVEYSEWREELIGLLTNQDGTELNWASDLSDSEQRKLAMKPIRYTWPGLLNRHKKPSYRYYDFTEKLNAKLPLKLFRRVRPADNLKSVECYKLVPAEQSVLTLAARRLKRDKIINKDKETGAWSSVDALWCPPLVLAGEENPTDATKPRAGKEKKKSSDQAEVSFSLIASPLPDDYWNTIADVPSTKQAEPVHHTVSFKIEGDEIAKLRAETKQWLSGSHRGFAKKGEKDADKRRHFNWPIDRETSKYDSDESNEKAKVLWCGSGKAGDEWKGFALRHDKIASSSKDAVYHDSDFHILSIDLGNRFAAAFARMRIHAEPNGDGRIISAGGFSPVIKADIVRQGTLRLQGENAKVWQHVREADGTCKKSSTENYVYALEDEEYGNQGRGRFPKDDEYTKFSKLAGQLAPVGSLSLSGKEKETYPELADHLVFRLKRRIGRLRTLLNLVWRLCAKHERNQRTGQQGKEREEADRLFHRRMTVETLARSLIRPPRQLDETEDPKDSSLRAVLAADEHWKKLKDDGLLKSTKGADEKNRCQKLEAMLKDETAWNWNALAEAVKKQIEEYMEGVPGDDERQPLGTLLVKVIEFGLPLRGRHWGWDRSRKARLHWDNKDDEHTPHIMGMRGLSMKRLEQISNLRQRCQSFAKLEDRYHGSFKAKNYNPPDPIAREAIDDVCPLLLDRSNRIREQRVDQAAHLILAEALGMELKSPEEVKNKKERKAEVDLHGEYKRRSDKNGKEYPRCSVIVLENLERYKTSQERTKTENSRLMKWAHRAIIEKLEDMCRPFGITLMLVDPAFTSHFDSRTGLPGVRVNEVPPGFENQYPYAKWKNDTTKSGGETQLAKDIKKLAADFEAHKIYTGKLVLAVEGGTDFVPVLAPLGGKDTFNADITAAVNIGLRAVADPQRWDIFPRLRTKKKSEIEVFVTNWRGWFGRFEKETEGRQMKKSATEIPENVAMKNLPSKKKAKPSKGESSEEAGSQTAQSSEYPPFFVQHPTNVWISEKDWLAKEAFNFSERDGRQLRAYPQGAYLKQVEVTCRNRINEINRARIQKWERGDDNILM